MKLYALESIYLPALYQGTILQLAEKCMGWSKKRQGMTLVVP
jgi:hypothetical protein